jgi:hypothetical protein
MQDFGEQAKAVAAPDNAQLLYCSVKWKFNEAEVATGNTLK